MLIAYRLRGSATMLSTFASFSAVLLQQIFPLPTSVDCDSQHAHFSGAGTTIRLNRCINSNNRKHESLPPSSVGDDWLAQGLRFEDL